MLSKNAFNALLKTLEEPPEHVKFILATTEINKVPVTILSRSGEFVAVEGQLKAGERVVSQGASAVRAAAATPGAFGHGHAH